MLNRRLIPLLILLVAAPQMPAGTPPAWTGRGRCRLLVHVEPIDIADRPADDMVARFEIDFAPILKELKQDGQADLGTLQVHRYDPFTGTAETFPAFDGAVSRYDRPCRFDDNAVPQDYPDRASYASDHPTGRGPVTIRKRGGRLFNREQNNTTGSVVWVHTQQANRPSSYAIYWDTTPTGTPTGPSPSPWIGDADVLRSPARQPLGGLSHFTACTADFNSDGLFDILAGCEKGDLMWFPNRGTRGHPRFVGCRMLTDEQGPIDCGWYSAPFVCDWDADGLPDLLAGTGHNVILWWKNIGILAEPKLSYRGFVQAGGSRLELPERPVAEDHAAIFGRDYYNQPWVGDWDGDGLADLLTGGYTTGHIFFYRCTGRESSGVPILEYQGPVQADGRPIDTVWAAAPAAGDLNADGKMELITGSWFWSGIASAPRPEEVEYLQYYVNTGTAAAPHYERQPFPRAGSFPHGEIARPSMVDWNDDGLSDLLVSDANGAVYCFLNVGRQSEPRWQMTSDPLTLPWGFVRAPAFSGFADRGPGEPPLLISGEKFAAFAGSVWTPRIEQLGTALVNSEPIDHPGPGYGDPYRSTVLTDWDRDGYIDLLWGTHQGEIYLHRAVLSQGPFAFAPGEPMKLSNGHPLRVGPKVVDSPKAASDFTVLQGSRMIIAPADFDGDGIEDLAVTETYGNIWVFRNVRAGRTDALEPGALVGKVADGRRSDDLNVVDWNQDGKPDLIIGQPTARPGSIYINRSTPGELRFNTPIQPLDLPFLFWGACFHSLDWNRDGDQDFMIQSEFYVFWAEGSFIGHGYREAVPLAAPEVKPASGAGEG